ncbi:MAG: tetratricopeptide repeat protein [Bacteroidetes bacterium]|nr:tetratricopeptide repeat protein [Bacteroidota bacterium]
MLTKAIFPFFIFIISFLINVSSLFCQNSPKKDTIQIKQYLEQALELKGTDLNAASSKAKTALTLSKSLSNKNLSYDFIARSCNTLGMIEVSMGDMDSAIYYFSNSLENNIKLKNNKAISKSYNNLGNANYYLGNFTESLSFYLKSLKLSEEIKDSLSFAKTSDNIGNVYLKLLQPEKAIPFHESSLKISSALKDSFGMGNSYINLGLAFQKQGKSNLNLSYQNKALGIFQRLNNNLYQGRCYNNIALAYDELNILDTALIYYKKALIIQTETGYKQGIALSNYNIGSILIQQKDFVNAFIHLQSAEQIFKEIENKENLKEVYKKLSEAANHIGKYEQAYNYLYLYNNIKDSVLNENVTQQIAELQTKYDTEKKDLQLKLQASELKEQNQKSFYTKIIFSAVIIFILLISLIIYFRIKQKQKIQSEIEKIKQENLLKQKEIETKENERNRMAAELHDNVGSSVSFISVKIDWLLHHQNLNDESKKELSLLKNSAQEVMSGLRETLWTLNAKSISNFDFCDKLKVYIKKHLMCECVITDAINEEYIIPNEDVLALYRCCQEIINNINKHSKATKVNISFISDAQTKLGIITEDNGIGFTESEKEESYGLRNIKARMSKINAEVKIVSELNKGTRIELRY